jgi:tetratricopeptide (TPR) repeat protein
MTSIPLRAYIRKIDDLIGSGKLDEAILHGRNILSSHPKYIDSYRLLGKALLENKQYDHAELLFNKILSVFPDDFIAHLGLSYIFETKSDFNESVNHLERAFEIQPANANIQEELKRLYKARDGVEPARIRLTRGALIKMYARSNLFQQAIAEARVALHEHPDRIDFEILLANMLSLSGQPIEAVEYCLGIISKSPYCFEANRILFQTLPESSDKYDVATFHTKLTEIDPYFKYVSKHRPDVFSIPEVAISVEEIQPPFADSSEAINWNDLLDQIWNDQENFPIKEKTDEISWDEIIAKHLEVPEAGTGNEKSNEFNESEPIPDWIKTEESLEHQPEPPQSTEDSTSDIEEESGSFDYDAPILEENLTEQRLPSSIWIQESEENIRKDEEEIENKNASSEIESSKKEAEKGTSRSDQYYEVVLKDAHDALLSGFSERAVDGYRQLLQDNKMTEQAAEQLNNDLINFPKNFDLWIILGDSYQRLGMATKALEAYQKAEKYLGNQKEPND